ncbi:uncharacterized protein LOC126742948 [Anthonomus grandis grandis]|uniref:uncharacterized protein LOC126742948 n=1 Tax=Anthonomus grandis grandis TaxID=2921223 RepID=UPI002165E9B5|nr:uncharacterized protein LOC126742948 [Anthonomus grandis grandis]
MEEYNFPYVNPVQNEDLARLEVMEVSLERMNTIVDAVENVLRNIQKLAEKFDGFFNSFVGLPAFRQNEIGNTARKNAEKFPQSEPNQPVLPTSVADSIEIPTVKSLTEIAGLKEVKSTIYTMVILPKVQPQLFKNRRASNTILLYGPPGTGKTRIVHGLAAETGAVLHTMSVGSLLSSFVGETEKNIKTLFKYLSEVEKFSILFIDEIDSLCRKRTCTENDYTRRIKTELMCQLTKMAVCRNILIVAATNCPWDLDSAILRRFHKRIYVPLPDVEDRLELFRMLTTEISIGSQTGEQFVELDSLCEGFSCSDIATVIQDALDIPLAELQSNTIWNKTAEGFYHPASEAYFKNIVIAKLEELPMGSVLAREVTLADFIEAARKVQRTVTVEDVAKYEAFRKGGG